MNLTTTQFTAGRGLPIRICPTASVGKQGRAGGAKSPKAPPNSVSKHSVIDVVMDKLLAEKAVSAICIPDQAVYAETMVWTSAGGTQAGAYFDGKKMSMVSTVPLDGTGRAVAFFTAAMLYALNSSAAAFADTRAAFADVSREFASSGSAQDDLMAYACSCFYYDTKEAFSAEIQEEEFSPGVEKLINQGLRTGSFRQADAACPVNAVFTHIEAGSEIVPPAVKAGGEPDGRFLESCKAGEYEIGMNWTREQQGHIISPAMLDGYVSSRTFEKLVKTAHWKLSRVIMNMDMGKEGREAIGQDYLNAIMVGKPGTGKTTAAEALSAALGLPLYTVPVTKNTEEDAFYGMTKAQDGGFGFVSTPFLDAFKNGGIVVIEEFNLADPGVLQGAIGQAIVPPFLMLEDGYRPVHRHPLCVFLLTMNTGTQGSREPNEALASRAPMVLVMEDPDQRVFTEILERKSGDAMASRKVHGAYAKIIDYLKEEAAGSEDLPMSVTMRHCIEALMLMRAGYTLREAIEDTMIGALAVKDLEIARDVKENVLDVLSL